MRLYFTRPEQIAVALLLLAICAGLVTLTIAQGQRHRLITADAPAYQHPSQPATPAPVIPPAPAVAPRDLPDPPPVAAQLPAPVVVAATVDVTPPGVSNASASSVATPPKLPATATGRGRKPLPDKPVNLNTATRDALMTLPGVGQVMAESIVAYRTAHGPFTDIAQLDNVPRIGLKTVERLRPYVTLQ